MKRVGRIFDAVVERENLRDAFLKASRGKRHRFDQRDFADHLDEELDRLREGLLNVDYPVGNYRRFMIYDPKEREICVAPFGERVLHHALMNVCEPWFSKWLVFDTYACRAGKGQLRAVRRAQEFARRNDWFLKCDFRKFFDSVPHDGLKRMLARKFKDPFVVAWFERIIGGYEKTPGRGLPIGNLTSQHLANLYLDPLDRLCQGAYVRYMDDFVLWSDSKDELKRKREEIIAFARETLGLELKGEPFINRTALGMDFLGLRVFPGVIRLAKRSRERFKRKARQYVKLLAEGVWDEATFQSRMTALTAFVEQAESGAFRRTFFRLDSRSGGRMKTIWRRTTDDRLQPRAARRRVQQRCVQLLVLVPQQQQAGQQLEQQRLPPVLSLSMECQDVRSRFVAGFRETGTKKGGRLDASSDSRKLRVAC